MAEDLAFMGAVELGKKIARGTVSSVEATKAMLDRIERLNGFLKCYEAVLAVQALGRPGARFVPIADELNAATRMCRKRERVIAAQMPAPIIPIFTFSAIHPAHSNKPCLRSKTVGVGRRDGPRPRCDGKSAKNRY